MRSCTESIFNHHFLCRKKNSYENDGTIRFFLKFLLLLDMVVSGVPKKNADEHANQIGSMALELVRQATTRCVVPYSNNEKLRIRVGLHSGKIFIRTFFLSTSWSSISGPVCAGVVGSKMPR